MDKSKLMLVVIIALLVLLLATVVGVTVYLIGLVGADTPDEFVQPVPPPVIGQVSMMDIIPVPIGDMIITGLAQSPDGSTGTVQMEAVAGINGTAEQSEIDAFMPEFELRIAIARNIILDILGNLTYEEIRTVEGRNATAEEIRLALSERFETNLIASIHFPEWRVVPGMRR